MKEISYFFKDDRNLELIKAQLGTVNCKATQYGFGTLALNETEHTITGVFKPLPVHGIGCYAALSREGKNQDFIKELSKLERLCRLSRDSNLITLTDGRKIECHVAPEIKSLNMGRLKENARLFFNNVLLFIEHSDAILSDSRMFLTPIYSQSFSPFFTRPTLGAFVEWWNVCARKPIERHGYPICYISGNPMTGNHACLAVAPDGNIVKAELLTSFIGLLRSFGSINRKYRHLSELCETYSIQEVVSTLKK